MADSIDARLNPAQAMAAAAAALSDDAVEAVVPIALPADGSVDLPGGFQPEGLDIFIRKAEVKELTGRDEEEIVRARRISALRVQQVILERGVALVGTQPATPDLLKGLILGDRDMLLLAIAQATYGEPLRYRGFRCPNCAVPMDVDLELSDIPVKRLEDGSERRFTVELRKGRTATVSLPTGADQEFVLTNAASDDASTAEINTLLLSRVVEKVEGPKGGLAIRGSVERARDLGVADRAVILREITKRQPGPRYDETTVTHPSCGKEVILPVGPGDLFPNL